MWPNPYPVSYQPINNNDNPSTSSSTPYHHQQQHQQHTSHLTIHQQQQHHNQLHTHTQGDMQYNYGYSNAGPSSHPQSTYFDNTMNVTTNTNSSSPYQQQSWIPDSQIQNHNQTQSQSQSEIQRRINHQQQASPIPTQTGNGNGNNDSISRILSHAPWHETFPNPFELPLPAESGIMNRPNDEKGKNRLIEEDDWKDEALEREVARRIWNGFGLDGGSREVDVEKEKDQLKRLLSEIMNLLQPFIPTENHITPSPPPPYLLTRFAKLSSLIHTILLSLAPHVQPNLLPGFNKPFISSKMEAMKKKKFEDMTPAEKEMEVIRKRRDALIAKAQAAAAAAANNNNGNGNGGQNQGKNSNGNDEVNGGKKGNKTSSNVQVQSHPQAQSLSQSQSQSPYQQHLPNPHIQHTPEQHHHHHHHHHDQQQHHHHNHNHNHQQHHQNQNQHMYEYQTHSPYQNHHHLQQHQQQFSPFNQHSITPTPIDSLDVLSTAVSSQNSPYQPHHPLYPPDDNSNRNDIGNFPLHLYNNNNSNSQTQITSIVITRCHGCGTSLTNEWMRGPDGPGSLCDVCGQHYAKLLSKKDQPITNFNNNNNNNGNNDNNNLSNSECPTDPYTNNPYNPNSDSTTNEYWNNNPGFHYDNSETTNNGNGVVGNGDGNGVSVI